MARLFDDASSEWAQNTSTPVTVPPLSMAAWFYSDDLTTHQTILCLYDYIGASTYYEHHRLMIRGNEAGDPVAAATQNPFTYAKTSTGYSANTWHHAAGVWTSATSRAAYIDGGSKGTDSTSSTPLTPDRLAIGVVPNSNDDVLLQFFSGNLAEIGLWNVALTDAEVASLASGYSPLLIRPLSLVAYWPFVGRLSPEIDMVGGYNMTLVNSPTTAAHPRVIYPPPPANIFPASVAPADLNIDRSHTNFDNWTRGVQIA